jgi:tetratricopeptide (TPR) repeat protein
MRRAAIVNPVRTPVADACEAAREAKKPFTHIHLLAHGIIIGKGQRVRYGVALHGNDGNAAPAEASDLVDAVKAVSSECSMVTLAVCHGGTDNNPVYPGSSLVHGLHAAGIPVAIGSQFPLTFPGAVVFAETFYSKVLRGEDVRSALHSTRLALKAKADETHEDWAALVGYVSLPEGYTDHLIDVALEANLASLRTTQSWFDHVVGQQNPAVGPMREIATRILVRVRHLEDRLSEAEACGRKGVYEENLGLPGSAEKRLAEVYFRLAKTGAAEGDFDEAAQALRRSRAHYGRSFSQNLSHHWTGTQMLSLEAALNGQFSDVDLWHAARAGATFGLRDENDYWSAGSLMELQLLAPFADRPDNIDAAKLARAMDVQLPEAEAARLKRTPAANPNAEDLALQCVAAVQKGGYYGKEAEAGYRLCDQALAVDPNNARALTWLSLKFVYSVLYGPSADPEGDGKRADELTSKALALDPNYAMAHRAKGSILAIQGRFGESVAEYERALSLDPAMVAAVGGLGSDCNYLGQFEEGREYYDKAIRLSPHDPGLAGWYNGKAMGYLALKQYDQTIDSARRAIAISPNNFPWPHLNLISALALAGHQAEAREALQRYLALVPNGPKTLAARKALAAPFERADSDPRFLEFAYRQIDGLRKAGMPEE